MQSVLKTLKIVLNSRKAIVSTVIGTGGYVAYTDSMRYSRMAKGFQRGNMIQPCCENEYETHYVSRPELEDELRFILGPEFTNEYYLVKGEVGSGKSRTIVEIVRKMIKEDGSKLQGAPIYILATQGNNFSDTLANAVRFNFDEHVNFQFFARYLMQIEKFPQKDNHNKLSRVLDAVEKAAFKYMHKEKKPLVLVIDGVNSLTDHFPGALEKLQEKAKLWADTNICKVVFVSNEEETEHLLQKSSSCWSRAGAPVHVSDLSKSEVIEYLTSPHFLEGCGKGNRHMSHMEASRVFDNTGGRIQYLTLFKRDFIRRVPFEATLQRLKNKEREKFIRVVRIPEMCHVIRLLHKAPGKSMSLSELVKRAQINTIDELARLDILKCKRSEDHILVEFESKITEATVDDLFAKHE